MSLNNCPFCDNISSNYVAIRAEGGACAGSVTASSYYSNILGGPLTNSNAICENYYSVIDMGVNNKIFGESCHNTIVNGANNCICNTPSDGCYNVIVQGYNQTISNTYSSAIISGNSHRICCGITSIIGGGNAHYICDGWNGIFSGSWHQNHARHAVIGGGTTNSINYTAPCAAILGGNYNQITVPYGTIVGGYCNSVSGYYSHIGNGLNNIVSGDYSFIGGGIHNIQASYASFIGGGQLNLIQGLGHHDTIAGGCRNRILAANKGRNLYSFIGGGCCNTISPVFTACVVTLCSGVIGGGSYNSICSFSYNTIGGGERNSISGYAVGANNLFGYHNTISGGCKNDIIGDLNTIAGGACNCINSGTPGFLRYNIIGGGCCNYITGFDTGKWNGILSGECNKMNGANHSFIGSGKMNCIDSGVGSNDFNVIAGGALNTICNDAHHHFIGSGEQNIICSGNHFGVIGGGYCNIIDGDHSAILGGGFNTVSGDYSTILGGSNNTVGASYSYAAVFGNSVSAVASNTFHVECLNAINTPIITTGTPLIPGTIFALNGPVPTGAFPLYFQP